MLNTHASVDQSTWYSDMRMTRTRDRNSVKSRREQRYCAPFFQFSLLSSTHGSFSDRQEKGPMFVLVIVDL
jgi:hypothetical protein